MENDMFYELLQQYKDFQGNVRQCIADLQNKIIELERVNKELTEKLKERNEWNIIRTQRLLRANGIIYGIVTSYKEDRHNYIFVANLRKLYFPKAKYRLQVTNEYYDIEDK